MVSSLSQLRWCFRHQKHSHSGRLPDARASTQQEFPVMRWRSAKCKSRGLGLCSEETTQLRWSMVCMVKHHANGQFWQQALRIVQYQAAYDWGSKLSQTPKKNLQFFAAIFAIFYKDWGPNKNSKTHAAWARHIMLTVRYNRREWGEKAHAATGISLGMSE